MSKVGINRCFSIFSLFISWYNLHGFLVRNIGLVVCHLAFLIYFDLISQNLPTKKTLAVLYTGNTTIKRYNSIKTGKHWNNYIFIKVFNGQRRIESGKLSTAHSNATEIAQWGTPSCSRHTSYGQSHHRRWIQLTDRTPHPHGQYSLSTLSLV